MVGQEWAIFNDDECFVRPCEPEEVEEEDDASEEEDGEEEE